MSFIKNIFFIIILNLVVFYNFSFSKESYLIKKKITKDTASTSSDNKKNKSSKENFKQKEKIKKEDKAKDEEDIKKEKNVLKNKDDTINKTDEKINKGSENPIILKDNKFRIIYKPYQIKLSQEDVIKVIEISSNFNKENILTIKSYASKNVNKGSSEARRRSLSRALEVRSLFVENEFPATNILVRALGSQENDEGYTDIIIIEVN
jgi:hypothetical protein